MKRTERHHLKQDPLASWLGDLRESLGRRGNVAAAGGLVVVALVLVGLVFGWQQWRFSRASELLAAAMVIVEAPVAVEGEAADVPAAGYPSVMAKLKAAVPKLLEAAEAYPSLQSGIAARYQAAAALSTLGRTSEAGEQYDRVVELDANGVYGRMARLGRAEAYLSAGDYAQAIQLLEVESAATNADVPVDAVLMRLGRAYRLADQESQAVTTFTRVVDEFPTSSYRFDAERELATLDGR